MTQQSATPNTLPLSSPYVFHMKGFPILKFHLITEQTTEANMNYVPRDGDVIIASSMKTGTTWFGSIVRQILTRGSPFHDPNVNSIVPYIGYLTADEIDKIGNPRIYMHHMPYHMVKTNKKAKCLYIYRNPEDTLVSAFHFLKKCCDEPFQFDDLFEDFLTGDSYPFGSYFDHVSSYISHQEEKNLFITSYEKIQENKEKEVLRIAKFLGEEYYRDIISDKEFMERVLKHTDFQYMKDNLIFGSKATVKFFRKGVVGDGHSTLTLEQRERLRKVAEKYMKGTEVYDEWYSYSRTPQIV